MSSIQCIEGYTVTLKFAIINIRLDKKGQLRNKVSDVILTKWTCQKHKRKWFDFVYLFAFKNRYWFKTFFRNIGAIFELCDIKNGSCLKFLVAASQP